MAGTRYIRYILFAVLCLIVLFFITSSSSRTGDTLQYGKGKIENLQGVWKNHYPGSHPEGGGLDVDKEQALIPEKSKTDSKPVDKPLGGPEDTAPKRPSKGDTAEKPSDKAAERPKTGTDDAASKQPGKDDASEKASSSERPSMKDRPATRPAITPNDKGRLPPAKGSGGKMNATFVTLARNSDVWDLAKSIRNIEDRFNRKYNYDWVFLNDKEFDDNFKTITSRLVSGTTRYGIIPEEHWSFPEWIDQDKAAEVRKDMAEKKIIYGDSISYRHMCRYESGFFFRHPLMNEYEWYWRVEPSIELYCDIDYDTFEYMSKHNKMYSFVISLYEYKETIPTIWDSVKKFMRRHPEHIPEKNLMEWVSEDGGETYNRCHFWSNFEIGNLNWLRSPKYLDFFDQLDKDGGFFYERWGDAPVHSLAAALTLEKDQIHFFNDIAYWHVPFTHCPTEEKVRLDNRCHCNPSDNFDWNGYSCTARYYDVMGKQKPAGAPLTAREKRNRIILGVILGTISATALAYWVFLRFRTRFRRPPGRFLPLLK